MEDIPANIVDLLEKIVHSARNRLAVKGLLDLLADRDSEDGAEKLPNALPHN